MTVFLHTTPGYLTELEGELYISLTPIDQGSKKIHLGPIEVRRLDQNDKVKVSKTSQLLKQLVGLF